jgi:predicted DNA-binding protein
MARTKEDPNAFYVSISTRINIDTAKRLDEHCKSTNAVKAKLIDQAINDYLDKLQMTN